MLALNNGCVTIFYGDLHHLILNSICAFCAGEYGISVPVMQFSISLPLD